MKPQYTVLALALVTAASATAQINREITVEREIVPEMRRASRISLMPVMVQPKFAKASLKFSDRAVESDITPMHSQLEPATTDEADSLAIAQRGYVDLGYFPTFNLGVSAGYRLIDNANTNVNAWLQYNGKKYDRHDLDVNRNTFTLGVDASHRLTNEQGVFGNINYTYDANKWNYPGLAIDGEKCKLNSNRMNLLAGYYGRTGAWTYRAALQGGVTTAANDKELNYIYKQNEYIYGVKGEVAYATGAQSRAGLRLDWLMRSETYGHSDADPSLTLPAEEPSNTTLGALKLNPYWDGMIAGGMNVELGLNADFSLNQGTAFNIAPECILSWAPSGAMDVFAMEVKATGGLYANTLASLFDCTPYIFPAVTYGSATINSHVPYDFAATVTIGPFSGAYLEVTGEYAKANNWQMAMSQSNGTFWAPTDIKGWMVGAKAGYKYGDMGEVSVAYQHAPSKVDKAFYRWRDRAQHVLTAELTVKPIKPLTVGLGFDARWGRSQVVEEVLGVDEVAYELYSLGALRNLWASAAYRITNNISVFVRCENLFNNDALLLGGVSQQGLTGLVGVQCTF